MLLNFWKQVTATLIVLAAKAHKNALQAARDRIIAFKSLIKRNNETIDQLEKANIEMENMVDETQDWIERNSDGNIIL